MSKTIGTIVSIGMLPSAVAGGAVAGGVTAKVPAGGGHQAATSGSATNHPIQDGGASASVGALHVLLDGAAHSYPKRLPVYYASGGSLTASGIPFPGPFLSNVWNHWKWADLPLWRDPLGPPSSGCVRVLYRETEPGEAAGLLFAVAIAAHLQARHSASVNGTLDCRSLTPAPTFCDIGFAVGH